MFTILCNLQVVMIIFTLCSTINGFEQYCYSTDPIRAQHYKFGLKKSYRLVQKIQSDYNIPECKPQKLWMLIRHGTRLPKFDRDTKFLALEELRDQIVKNYENRNSKWTTGGLCELDFEALKRWRWNQNVTVNKSFGLTQEGWEEIKLLALRYQHEFPELLNSSYYEQNYSFKYTDTQRAEASFQAFAEGLFENKSYNYIKSEKLPENDTILSSYFNCKKWSLKGDFPEVKAFEKTMIVYEVVKNISHRLGVNHVLNFSEIDVIFDICRYDVAWNKPSPWCAAFTPADIDVLEYWDDLEAFYRKSFGRDVNKRIECELVKELLTHLSTYDLPKVSAYFAHSSTFILFLTAMGVPKDVDHLGSDNYLEMRNRNFKTSELSPFGANLVIANYDCPLEVEREKVRFYLNEKILSLDFCENDLCNLSDVMKRYDFYAKADCPNEFCTTP